MTRVKEIASATPLQKSKKFGTLLTVYLLAAVFAFAGQAAAKVSLDSSGTFTEGSFELEVWQNGGFFARLNGETLLDESGIYTGINGWMPYYNAEITEYKVNVGAGTVAVKGKFRGTQITFSQTFSTDGSSIAIKIALGNTDWSTLDWAAFEVKFPTGKYTGKKYATNNRSGFYPQDVNAYELEYGFRKIELAPGSSALNLKVESSGSNLFLADDRYYKDNTFQVGADFDKTTNPSFTLKITPPANSGGGDDGDGRNGGSGGVSANGVIIHVNQLGYAPDDEKWAIVEDARNTGIYAVVRLQRKFKAGGWRTVRQYDVDAEESRWGSRFLRFDFSDYSREGTYRITFNKSTSFPFRIGRNVYKDLHAQTIDTYVPIQMSHISVRFGQLGHDKCFMDDGIHIGPNHDGPDNFKSLGSMEPGSQPGTHLGLNVGGWHDAGDYDINVANNSYMVLLLSWSFERYGDKRDNYGIKWGRQDLNTNKGNKIPDIVEQIAWGSEWLLSMQKENGRVYDAVVANSHDLWCAEKAPEKLTDNKIFAGAVAPGSVSNTSMVEDDRNVYTNTTTPNLLKFTAATAAASRVVRGYDYQLSNRLVAAAESAWKYFRSNNQIWVGQFDQYKHGKEQMMLAAAAELYRTTGKGEYLNYIKNNKSWIDGMSVEWPGYINSFGNWFALPFLARLDAADNDLRDRVRKATQRWVDYNSGVEGGNIFGVNIENLSRWWGSSSDYLGFASTYAILHEEFPAVVPAKRGKRYLHWVLGMHPGPDYSFVTGIGSNSPKFPHSQLLLDLYGGAPGGIDGGVVPGLQLDSSGKRLNYKDHRQIPSQNEYTLDAAASFLYAAQAWQ